MGYTIEDYKTEVNFIKDLGAESKEEYLFNKEVNKKWHMILMNQKQ